MFQGYLGDFLAFNVYTSVNSSGKPLDVIFLKNKSLEHEKDVDWFLKQIYKNRYNQKKKIFRLLEFADACIM